MAALSHEGSASTRIFRLHPDGRLDASFGTGGMIDVAATPRGATLLVAPQGDFFVRLGPNATGSHALLAFDERGNTRTAIGKAGGIDLGELGRGLADPSAVVTIPALADGWIYVLARPVGASPGRPRLARFTAASGQLDTSLGDRGIAVVDGLTAATGLDVSTDELIVTGRTSVGSRQVVALARFSKRAGGREPLVEPMPSVFTKDFDASLAVSPDKVVTIAATASTRGPRRGPSSSGCSCDD